MMHSARRGLEWIFARILDPFERFLRRTTAGGIVLVAATALALLLAWTLGGPTLDRFWEQRLSLGLGEGEFSMSLRHWVNDGLMALFFLLVGLELKREILVGELASIRDAALPIVAAMGGMALPAAIYAALNAGTPYAGGWGIPMATDIAFAVGILVLLAWRIPRNLIVFLTALAIADDLGAVLVIALFYTANLAGPAIAASAGLCMLLGLFNLGGVRHPLPYIVVGCVLWATVHASGVHATVAGILLAAALPARGDPAPLETWEHWLTPWVTFLVIPVFALANAAIDLSAIAWSQALSSSLTLGIVGGLAIGKFVGISLASWIAVRMRIAWLGGIGFTMSLFIGQLAFTDAAVVEQAKLGVLLGSAVSAVAGLAWLLLGAKGRTR
jgi:NhaA family Na+:H+ antiporter